MKIDLKCPKNFRPRLEKLLKARHIHIDADAPVHMIARGEPLPDQGVTIVFDVEQSDKLAAFLDDCFQSQESSLSDAFLPGKTAHGFKLIPIEDVSYFKADGNYIYARVDDKPIEVEKKLYELEEIYRDKGFIRISKSYIVNIVYVREILPWFSGKLILKLTGQDREMKVSRNYVKNFKKFIGMGK